MKAASLRLRLIIILSLSSLLLWGGASIIAWFKVKDETDKIFDAQQILFAQRLSSSNLRQILVQHHSNKFSNEIKMSRQFHKKMLDDDALAFAIFNRKIRISTRTPVFTLQNRSRAGKSKTDCGRHRHSAA